MVAPIPLVYVLSNGRSGSTVLELLLGNHPRAFSVGELHVLPHELEHEDARCGCGEHPAACPFWSAVLEDFELADDRAQLTQFRGSRDFGKVLRYEHLRGLLSGRVAADDQQRAADYGALNHRLFERINNEAARVRGGPIDWLVDASKDPYRLLWLADSGRFDLRVVHLVRDPRSFVHSMVEGRSAPNLRSVLRLCARWAIENVMMNRLAASVVHPSQVMQVRYEELAGAPRATLEKFGAWLQLDFDSDWSDGAFRAAASHAVSGNQSRFRTSGVRLDERWRDQSPAWVQRLVWIATAPARAALGWT